MLSTPLPKLCDKLPELTYGRGGGFGRGWGDLSHHPNAGGKGLSWQTGNQASGSISATSL